MCLVRGGHEIILSAFDNFKEVRFSALSGFDGHICSSRCVSLSFLTHLNFLDWGFSTNCRFSKNHFELRRQQRSCHCFVQFHVKELWSQQGESSLRIASFTLWSVELCPRNGGLMEIWRALLQFLCFWTLWYVLRWNNQELWIQSHLHKPLKCKIPGFTISKNFICEGIPKPSLCDKTLTLLELIRVFCFAQLGQNCHSSECTFGRSRFAYGG